MGSTKLSMMDPRLLESTRSTVRRVKFRSPSSEVLVFQTLSSPSPARWSAGRSSSIPASSATPKDQDFAERLHADLQEKKLRVWFAPEHLMIGDRFQERIEESIRLYDKVMIVLSESSVQSRWVEREANAAREREERDKRLVLFPIRIDEAVMTAPHPWAADIRRSRHIGDFRGWKDHDSYQKAFQRLLRDLAPGPTPKP